MRDPSARWPHVASALQLLPSQQWLGRQSQAAPAPKPCDTAGRGIVAPVPWATKPSAAPGSRIRRGLMEFAVVCPVSRHEGRTEPGNHAMRGVQPRAGKAVESSLDQVRSVPHVGSRVPAATV